MCGWSLFYNITQCHYEKSIITFNYETPKLLGSISKYALKNKQLFG